MLTARQAGVDTNTMHKVAAQVQAAVTIPLLDLADVTAETVLAAGLTTVGLLGTAFTMEQAFYLDRLASHGLTVLVPDRQDRAAVHAIISERSHRLSQGSEGYLAGSRQGSNR